MTVKADDKKRVVLPGANPGDVFDCENQGPGRFLLIRLNKPEPPKRKTRKEVLKAIEKSTLHLDMSWEELKAWTRQS